METVRYILNSNKFLRLADGAARGEAGDDDERPTTQERQSAQERAS
jgi:hypothetical protein